VKVGFVPKDTILTGFQWVKKDFARSVATKQSLKNNRNAKEINCHELFEKPGEIASLRSQNPYTYYALTVYMNF
jgi:hypothetical protein